ncbi:MAG TPA: glycosyltransferase family 2 protein [Polyangia bacterium]|nr:glycosyltransferase family 2 protein [Polyangia bacterium]
MTQRLSIVIPIFNEEPIIEELDRRLRAFLTTLESLQLTWEVIFVNDGSRDASLAKLRVVAAKEHRYKVVSFSRNFGHQIAITAGVDRAEGDAVVVMDADLQDPPEVVAEMVRRWREGYDVVYGVRSQRRGETIFKKLTAAIFYRFLRSMTGVEIPVDVGDFRLMSRPAVLALRALRERHRFVRGMVAWIGFRQTGVTYERAPRAAGETKYPLRKMVRFALDGITSFSTLPLRIATWLGVLSGFAAVGVGIWAVYIKFFVSGVVPGWTTIMILIAFSSSVQLMVMGILGEYVGRAYEELKQRPLYLVSEQINLPDPLDERNHQRPAGGTIG